MEHKISRLFVDYFFGNWQSDIEQHSAVVVQRLRPPRKEDAELLGLKRIQEYCEGVVSCCSSSDTQPVGFTEGRGAYIREYFELVVMPLLANALAAFRPHARAVGRTASDVTYVVERPRFACPAGDRVLGLHAELYDALASDEACCYHDMCVDFVLVSGKMFYSITPEFFGSLLVAYQFPFGVVLLHKASAPMVLVIVSYSSKRGMTVLGGAGDPACGVLVENKPSIRSLSASSRKPRRRSPVGKREDKRESDDDSESITTWYSKPWIHPARSFRRFEDDDMFGRPSSVARRTTLPSVARPSPLEAKSSSALINERKCSLSR